MQIPPPGTISQQLHSSLGWTNSTQVQRKGTVLPVYCFIASNILLLKMCIDGGLTDNLPVTSNPHLITVTPFSGEADICPNDSSSIHQTFICGITAQVCWSNIRKSVGAILPMKWEEVETLYHQGYQDTLHFLEREGSSIKQVWYMYGIVIDHLRIR